MSEWIQSTKENIIKYFLQDIEPDQMCGWHYRNFEQRL